MTNIATLRRDWLSNPRADILAGIVVALALIPEAIGFSIIAGVDPRVGLYASVAIAIVISFTGGRPGMISAATAAVAVVVVPLGPRGACSGCIEAMTPCAARRGISARSIISTCSIRWRRSRGPFARAAAA